MAGLLYYLPDAAAVNAELIERLGLADRLGTDSIKFVGVQDGPAGRRGAVCTHDTGDARTPKRVGYYPDVQRWTKARDGAYWIGHNASDPPKPEDLVRADAINGHWVTLGDGQQWLIPTARILPAGFRLNEQGEWTVGETLPRFAEFSRRVEKLWQVVVSEYEALADKRELAEDAPTLSVAERIDLAAEALSINYRAGRWEASHLGLLDATNLSNCLRAIVDLPSIEQVMRSQAEAAQKKSPAVTPDGCSTDAGGSGSSRATCPPVPISTSSPEGGE